MCDYSLAGLPNRLAVEGEDLVVNQFRTGSKGLASLPDIQAARTLEEAPKSLWQWIKTALEDSRPCGKVAAVCVPPGARLLLKNIPADLQRRWNIGDEEKAVFVQLSAAENTYRDAVQFGRGTQVRLQELRDGMLVQVISLEGADADKVLNNRLQLA